MHRSRATAVFAVLAWVGTAPFHVHGEEARAQPAPRGIEMPPPAGESGNVYARGMSAILSHQGCGVSYDRVMGLTGVAFILQVDTAGPRLPDNELDCAWWPNDDWGFELGLPVLAKAVGWELRRLACDMSAYKADPVAEYRRALAPAVEQALRAGKPVLAPGFVVTGTDDQQPPLLGYGTRGKSTQYGQQTARMERVPWLLYLIGERTTPGSAADVDRMSLRHIIALFNETAQGAGAPKTRFSGRQAWSEWLRLLREGSACDNNMLLHLRYNRTSAVAYLRDMTGRHAGAAATHLSAAADIYQRVADEATKQGLPYSRVKSGEDRDVVRAEYAAMVERVSKLETQAIAELEAAVGAMAAEP